MNCDTLRKINEIAKHTTTAHGDTEEISNRNYGGQTREKEILLLFIFKIQYKKPIEQFSNAVQCYLINVIITLDYAQYVTKGTHAYDDDKQLKAHNSV